MIRSIKSFSAALCAASTAAFFLFTSTLAAAPPATAPAKQPRSIAAIEADLNATKEKLNEAIPYPKLLGEAKFRKENAEKISPLLNRMAELLDEVATTQNMPAAGRNRMQCLSMSAALGDPGASKILNDLAASKDPDQALDAKSWLVLGRWVNASEDAKAQQKILDEFIGTAVGAAKNLTDLTAQRDTARASTPPDPKKIADLDAAIAKANASQENIADTLMIMSQLGPANDAMSRQALAVVKDHLNSESARQAAAKIDAEAVQRAFVGRPLRISGRTITGENFSINRLRGKVILVDFWATWCGPCREFVPVLKKLYADYHDKGLEIVGVDNDSADDKVAGFIKTNAMPWPQFRESTQNDDDNVHPLAKRYGIDSLPTIYLIDAKGNLRYIDGHEDLETKVKKLLAEMPKPAPAPSPAK
ncbi:MAG: thioredoxin domain-containing protein [Phycisphaerales bacterium]|nr:thioredoxin domain-containing protein [Phycisphaerales bacterium]